jgi:hypothetical protein
MEIPPELIEYIDNNRGSLPPVTDPDEPLQLDSLSMIRMVGFLEMTWVIGLKTRNS